MFGADADINVTSLGTQATVPVFLKWGGLFTRYFELYIYVGAEGENVLAVGKATGLLSLKADYTLLLGPNVRGPFDILL